MAKSLKIQYSDDYSIFKKFQSNRLINTNHQKKLVSAIKLKNMLHLFPIVVDGEMQIIDGQHRLAAAKELNLPIYFVVDDEVNKADIAMVNNNRKSWTARDYISFHANEGLRPYKSLSKLLASYSKLTVMGAVKLMRPDLTSYFDTHKNMGGGNDTVKLRSGNITDAHFEHAVNACEIAKALYPRVDYIFRPDLLMEIKKAVVDNDLSRERATVLMKSSIHLFPKNANNYDLAPNRLIRQILIKK